MGLCFVIYMFLSNNPSSGDINSSNLSCFTYYNMVFKMALYLALEKKKCIFTFCRKIFAGCLKLRK